MFEDKNLDLDFKNIEMLLIVYLTIPLTSCVAERSFSAMKRIKTYLRNKMSDDRLSNLALLHIEKSLTDQVDNQKVIKAFASIPNAGRKTQFF